MSRKVIAISPFALSEKSGHLLLDDEFYVKYLLESNVDFLFYTSSFSARRISDKNPAAIDNLRILNSYSCGINGYIKCVKQIKIPFDSTVIFFSYSEKIITIFLLFNWSVAFRLILVATNNISASRIAKYRYELIIFFSLVRFKLKRLIVHTRFEKKCISNLLPWVMLKCFVKTHHLMLRRNAFVNKFNCFFNETNKISISFFGPSSLEKPIEPLLELIRLDVDRRFQFRLYNIGKHCVKQIEEVVENYSNVSVINQYLTDEEYDQAFSRSDLVFMSHNRNFEGKLSGNLCDCISLGVPFVSNSIEPINEMLDKYGDIGFIVDMNQLEWVGNLIDRIGFDSVFKKRASIIRAQKFINYEKICYDLDLALNLYEKYQ